MKYENQNRIKTAISHRINLGIELYDGQEQELDLSTDLQKQNASSKFIPLNVFKNIDDYVNDFILYEINTTVDYENSWIFEILCCQYEDTFYGIYKAHDYKYEPYNIILGHLIFKLCQQFGTNINLNWIDVSQLTTLQQIFLNSNFNGDISHWDTSNVRNMCGMFGWSKFNGDISHWDTSKVTNMSDMFRSSEFNHDISQWDVSNVQDMSEMFRDAKFSQDISNWDINPNANITQILRKSKLQLKKELLPLRLQYEK